MKAIIIDDENKARRLLEALLKDIHSNINTYFHAADLISGIEIIRKEKPQIVFLDIEMPNESGLKILDYFENHEVDFQIIFVTAYNNYAIEAFKLSAIDYLLKPVDPVELQKAVDKAQDALDKKGIGTNVKELKKIFKKLPFNKIAIEIPKGILFIPQDEIIYFEADGMYTKVYLANNQEELICKPLKHFVEQLVNKSFFYRPHRSYIVNLKHIREFSRKDGAYLILSNNKGIPIAKDKKEEFLSLIQEYF